MNYPPPSVLALAVIVVLACLALGTVLAVLRKRRVSRGLMAFAIVVVLGAAGLVTWIALVLPAYWD